MDSQSSTLTGFKFHTMPTEQPLFPIANGTTFIDGRDKGSGRYMGTFSHPASFQQNSHLTQRCLSDEDLNFAWRWDQKSFSKYGQGEAWVFEPLIHDQLYSTDVPVGMNTYVRTEACSGFSPPLTSIKRGYDGDTSRFPYGPVDAEPGLTDDASPDSVVQEQVIGSGCKKRMMEPDVTPRKRACYKYKSTTASTSNQITTQGAGTGSKKTRHDIVERRYRGRMNSAIEALCYAVPFMRDSEDENQKGNEDRPKAVKHFKVPILQGAKRYIGDLEQEVSALKKQKYVLSAQLTTLQTAFKYMPAPMAQPFTGEWYDFGVDVGHGFPPEDSAQGGGK
ncbi:hypothetical protein N3K66_007273 [Trichothecium roseum]|uniref:Uncharacterized protein n=1 Tax=Trichothecium roseum TaxID=47278 RepID=A0ACC0UV89_9HYPO|nr:hypothetical protein N3K66_007273 [Trichothecium roseum]